MPFEKNHKKVGGRKKGSLNKKPKDHHERILYVLNLLEKRLESDIESLCEQELEILGGRKND